MQHIIPNKYQLNSREFTIISKFIYSNFGIVLPLTKLTLVEARLQKRLSALQMKSFHEYVKLVMSPEGKEEVIFMIDKISTNETYFFREWNHFDFIIQNLLPNYEEINTKIPLKIWSSASSSGQECYSIAMSIEEYIRKSKYSINYSILGSDISTTVLQQAVDAVYRGKDLEKIPLELRKRYFLRSKDPTQDKFRINSEIREKVNFKWLNLMNQFYNVSSVSQDFDIIFCRNVLIYFDRETQKEVIRKLLLKLKRGGYLFLGHTESAFGLNLPLKVIQPSIYQKE
jgi:chemotaxis protein methyltransferase CheR